MIVEDREHSPEIGNDDIGRLRQRHVFGKRLDEFDARLIVLLCNQPGNGDRIARLDGDHSPSAQPPRDDGEYADTGADVHDEGVRGHDRPKRARVCVDAQPVGNHLGMERKRVHQSVVPCPDIPDHARRGANGTVSGPCSSETPSSSTQA